jgi:hypothetical protein
MVVFELVRGALEWLSSVVGVNLDPAVLLAIAGIVVGVYYAREIAGFLRVAATWIQIGTLVGAGLLLAAVLGVAGGYLSLDGGAVEAVLRQLGGVVRSVHV